MVTTRRRTRLSDVAGDDSVGEASVGSSSGARRSSLESVTKPNKRARKSEEDRSRHDAVGNDDAVEGKQLSLLADFGINTSEDLIRTLKSRVGTKGIGNQTFDKIDVAAAAWRDGSVLVPRKGKLLLDWVFDELIKDAKFMERPSTTKGKELQGSLLADPRYWNLASSIVTSSDKARVARLGSLQTFEGLLFSSGLALSQRIENKTFDIGTEGEMVEAIGLVLGPMASLYSANSNQSNIDLALSGFEAWLSILVTLLTAISENNQVHQQDALLRNLATLMHLCVQICDKHVKKVSSLAQIRDRFFSSLLEDFSSSIALLAQLKDHVGTRSSAISMEYLRASLFHFSYVCLFSSNDDQDIGRQIIAQVKNLSENGAKWNILSTLFAQKCLSLKRELDKSSKTLSQQADAQHRTYVEVAAPFIHFATRLEDVSSATRHDRLESLQKIVDLAEKFHIDLTKTNTETFELGRTSALDEALAFCMHTLRIIEDDDMQSFETTISCVRTLHLIDSKAIQSKQWAEIVSSFLWRKASKPSMDLLISLCDSSARHRTLDSMIEVLFDAISLAREKKDFCDWERMRCSSFFVRKVWEDHIGIALADFVSDQQALDILRTVQERLQSLQDSSGKRDDRATNTAPLLFLAAQIVCFLAMPNPTIGECIGVLRMIQSDVVQQILKVAIAWPKDASATSNGMAALVFNRALSNRCLELGQAGQDLLKYIDAWEDNDLHPRLECLYDLEIPLPFRAALSQDILEQCRRAELLQRRPDLASVLNDHRFYKLLGDNVDGKRWMDASIVCLWDAIASTYLHIIDQHASVDRLGELAASALDVLIYHNSFDFRHAFSSVKTLFTNGRNLELGRWQSALSNEIEKRLTKAKIDDAVELLRNLAACSVRMSTIKVNGDLIRTTCRRMIEAASHDDLSSSEKTREALRWSCQLLDSINGNFKLEDILRPKSTALLKAAVVKQSDRGSFFRFLLAMLRNIQGVDNETSSQLARNMIRTIDTFEIGTSVSALKAFLYELASNTDAQNGSPDGNIDDMPFLSDNIFDSTYRLRALRQEDLHLAVETVLSSPLVYRLRKEITNDKQELFADCCVEVMHCVALAADRGMHLAQQKGKSWLQIASELYEDFVCACNVSPYLLAADLALISSRAPPDEYSTGLEHLFAEMSPKGLLQARQWIVKLRLLALYVCNGPEGSLQISQFSVLRLSATLQSLYERSADKLDEGALAIAETIEALVLGRAIIFRQREAGACLAIMTALLRPRPNVPVTGRYGSSIFSSLTSSLTALVRLRPHALSALMPQVTLVLTRLVTLFREPIRQHAGQVAKQSSRAAYSSVLPPWLNVCEAPLDVSCARQLSRVLSAMTVRTTTNVTLPAHSQQDKKHKRSLSKPFGNHAIYVLLAFIRTLTQLDEMTTASPASRDGREGVKKRQNGAILIETSFVRGETRQEVARAMYSVCDVVNVHQRNLLMVMLADDGERVVARQLLHDYESQRYRGE